MGEFDRIAQEITIRCMLAEIEEIGIDGVASALLDGSFKKAVLTRQKEYTMHLDIRTATGKNLDVACALAGVVREGRTDEEFREKAFKILKG